MERHGHAHFQHLALVDAHRKKPTVSLHLIPHHYFARKFTGHFFYVESYHGKLCYRFDYIREGRKLYKDMNRLVAFYKGLTTWARWVNFNVDPTKTKVFFQGISPTHYE